jgi:hypothetical protein
MLLPRSPFCCETEARSINHALTKEMSMHHDPPQTMKEEIEYSILGARHTTVVAGGNF